MIDISDADIKHATEYLFGESFVLDSERSDFIKNLSCCFLHAVPGAGKTTALLVKLFILAEKLAVSPSDKKGILVLSHTNVAVDTIRERFGARSRNIEKYPSHISTLQSFVNKFLFFPYFYSLHAKFPEVISFEQMKAHAAKFLSRNPHLSHAIANYCQLAQKGGADAFLANLYISPEGVLSSLNNDFNLKDKTSNLYKSCYMFASFMMQKAIFQFDVAYVYALAYLQLYPSLKDSFGLRFSYVFMDEVQDSSSLQLQVIASLFAPVSKDFCFQMIGDLDQRLYGDNFDMPNEFQLPAHYFQKSMRFSKNIALAVSQFAANEKKIVGNFDCYIKPCIYLYEPSNISLVVPFFLKDWERHERQLGLSQSDLFVVGARLNSTNTAVAVSDYLNSKNLSLPHSDDSEALPLMQVKLQTMISYGISVEKALGLHSGDIIHNGCFISIIYDVLHGIPYDLNNLKRHVSEILGPNISINELPDFSNSVFSKSAPFLSDKRFRAGSVHSVKGLTSHAVLLLDTNYKRKYTSQMLLGADASNSTEYDYTKRLVYVALSRAKYFAAWAIPKSIFHRFNVDCSIWDVCDINRGSEPVLQQGTFI